MEKLALGFITQIQSHFFVSSIVPVNEVHFVAVFEILPIRILQLFLWVSFHLSGR